MFRLEPGKLVERLIKRNREERDEGDSQPAWDERSGAEELMYGSM